MITVNEIAICKSPGKYSLTKNKAYCVKAVSYEFGIWYISIIDDNNLERPYNAFRFTKDIKEIRKLKFKKLCSNEEIK